MSRFSSSWETVGNSADPDVLYYNASIVNNTTDDTEGVNAVRDPPIRFNETRDTAIIKDASRYQFSIIRFVVNGGNKDLPLFIPAIQSSTGQINPDLTEYGLALTWNGFIGGDLPAPYAFAPPIAYVEYISETQNRTLAPIPNPPSSPDYVGLWNGLTVYQEGNIVSGILGSEAPYYQAQQTVPAGNDPISNPVNPAGVPYWAVVSSELGRPQDLSSRYYYVYTFQHWVDLVNNTLVRANLNLYNQYRAVDATTYPAFSDWLVAYPTPRMIFTPTTQLFTIYYPPSFLPQTSLPSMSLFFNSNMFGLFANFNNTYYNTRAYNWLYPPPIPTLLPPGYVNQMVVQVLGLNDNLITVAPYEGWVSILQDFNSTSTLWSPIESIVFTSTLLPIQNEQTAPPNVFGTGNIGNSASTSQSAFQPIITDVALDLSNDTSGYRKMIYYAPVAEYRMADFQNSKQDIRSIDIQVYWKNRLDNQLYPITMFNLSSVSFKMIFRKKASLYKSERSDTSGY